MHWAAATGNPAVLQDVIAVARRERTVPPAFTPPTPLHVAVADGFPQSAKLLLEQYGMRADQPDAWGRSATEMACMQRWPAALFTSTFGEGPETACPSGAIAPLQQESGREGRGPLATILLGAERGRLQ